jgi:hypothetical protein
MIIIKQEQGKAVFNEHKPYTTMNKRQRAQEDPKQKGQVTMESTDGLITKMLHMK